MTYCAGQIKYLTAIKDLINSGETNIKCVTIARHLGVSRPSVSKMLRCLADFGLVAEDFCSGVELTEKGNEVVCDLMCNYNEIYIFFKRILRLSHEEAKAHTMLFISTFPQSTGSILGEVVRKSIRNK